MEGSEIYRRTQEQRNIGGVTPPTSPRQTVPVGEENVWTNIKPFNFNLLPWRLTRYQFARDIPIPPKKYIAPHNVFTGEQKLREKYILGTAKITLSLMNFHWENKNRRIRRKTSTNNILKSSPNSPYLSLALLCSANLQVWMQLGFSTDATNPW